MIRITTKKDGFRRAGMAHHGTKDYPDDAFTPEQIAQLEAEPMLVVQRLDEAPPAQPQQPGLAQPKPAKTPEDPPAVPAKAVPGGQTEGGGEGQEDEKSPEEEPKDPAAQAGAEGDGEGWADEKAPEEKQEDPAASKARKAREKK